MEHGEEEPNIVERERAMGFVEGDTHAEGLTEADRCELFGRIMDGHMMAWLGVMLATLNLPWGPHSTPAPCSKGA